MSTHSSQSDWIARWSRNKSAASPSLELRWKDSLTRCAHLPQQALDTVIEACQSPDTLRHLAQLLLRESDPAAALADFLRCVNDSDDTLEDWLESIATISRQTAGAYPQTRLSGAMGYVHCASFTVNSGERFASLPQATATMLETYGYEARTELDAPR